jgi:hypothetical protein
MTSQNTGSQVQHKYDGEMKLPWWDEYTGESQLTWQFFQISFINSLV